MVGGLVEQQQVGLLKQQPAQRDAAALAARELGDVGVARRAAQRVHRDLDLGVQIPGVGRVDLFLKLALLRDQRVHFVVAHGLGEFRADLLELVEQVLGRAHAVHDVAEHIFLWIEHRLLFQKADAAAFGGPGLAVEFGIARPP